MVSQTDKIKENERQIKALWDKYDAMTAKKVEEDQATALWRNEYKNKLWGFFSIGMFFMLLAVGEAIWLLRLWIQTRS